MTSKPVYDKGSSIAFRKPLSLPVLRPEAMPSASDCPQSLIVVNDSADGQPRGRVSLSNGASWDGLAFAHEIEALRAELRNASCAQVQIIPPPAQNVASIVEAVLSRVLPGMVAAHMPSVPQIMSPAQIMPAVASFDVSPLLERISNLEDGNRVLSRGILDLSEQMRDLLERIHYLEHNALAAVRIEERVA